MPFHITIDLFSCIMTNDNHLKFKDYGSNLYY